MFHKFRKVYFTKISRTSNPEITCKLVILKNYGLQVQIEKVQEAIILEKNSHTPITLVCPNNNHIVFHYWNV